MEKFSTLTAVACPLGIDNVDTDQLIPARFMSRSRAAGYGGFLLHDLRFDAEGSPRPDFPLNAARYAGAKILLANRMFGTGSSREAAVYALLDYGVRCVIAPSFGDIFEANAIKNGLLPAVVSEADVRRLSDWLAAGPSPQLTVDLEQRSILACTTAVVFSIDPVRRLRLLNGWDDDDLTRQRAPEIAAFRRAHIASAPWVIPRGGRSGD